MDRRGANSRPGNVLNNSYDRCVVLRINGQGDLRLHIRARPVIRRNALLPSGAALANKAVWNATHWFSEGISSHQGLEVDLNRD